MSMIQHNVYSYDGLGNLLYRQDATRGNLEERFTYDNLNRLKSAQTGNQPSLAYTYYANGNIKNKPTVAGSNPGTYQYGQGGSLPHAVTSAHGYSMRYDANGNVNQRWNDSKEWTFRWAGFDKPRWLGAYEGSGSSGSGQALGFTYGPDQMRVAQYTYDSLQRPDPDDSTSWYPDHATKRKLYVAGGGMEVEYVKPQGGEASAWDLDTVRIYVPSPEGRAGAAELKPDQSFADHHFELYFYDHLGSIQAVTDIATDPDAIAVDLSGDPDRKQVYSYDAWGERRDPGAWSGYANDQDAFSHGGADDRMSRGFTGHEMLDELGLIHMNGRIYDPLLGRFLSADILVQDLGNLQSYNRYSYVMNNPLGYFDPSGYVLVRVTISNSSGVASQVIDVPDGETVSRLDSHGSGITLSSSGGATSVQIHTSTGVLLGSLDGTATFAQAPDGTVLDPSYSGETKGGFAISAQAVGLDLGAGVTATQNIDNQTTNQDKGTASAQIVKTQTTHSILGSTTIQSTTTVVVDFTPETEQSVENPSVNEDSVNEEAPKPPSPEEDKDMVTK